MSGNATFTSTLNGPLWGARAADWSAIQEGQCQPVYEAVLERLKVGEGKAHLDAGCGAGLATQMAAVRGAKVSGVDASDRLLAIARTRVPAAEFVQCDLETLPFADATFDTIAGFNSFQYAGNSVAALTDARRVLKPGAVVAVVTWGPPEAMPAATLVAALRPLLPTPPPGAPGPFALSNEAALRGFAESAGLEPTEVFDVESPFCYATLEKGIRGLGSSGVAERARKASSAEAVDRAHAEALSGFRQPDGSYRVAAVFRCLLARPR